MAATYVQAHYAYEAQDETDLTLEVDDIIEIIQNHEDPDWWEGRNIDS